MIRCPEAMARAVEIFDASDYLTGILIRHPEEIATLAEVAQDPGHAGGGRLFQTALGIGRTPGDPVFTYVASAPLPYGEKLALLRQHFRHRIFAVGARDITEQRNVYESFGAIAAAADDAIAAAFGIVGEPMASP